MRDSLFKMQVPHRLENRETFLPIDQLGMAVVGAGIYSKFWTHEGNLIINEQARAIGFQDSRPNLLH